MSNKLEVKIHWSENAYVNAKMKELGGNEAFYPVEEINHILRVATWDMVRKDDLQGYDKTQFTLLVTKEDGSTDTYDGRIDLGSDTQDMHYVVQEHITAYLEYLLSDKVDSYSKPSKEQRIEILEWCLWMCASIKETKIEDREAIKHLLV